MNSLFRFLKRKKTVGEVLSLKQYRHEREEVHKVYEIAREKARKEFENEISIPLAKFNTIENIIYNDYLRAEAQLWEEHLGRIDDSN